MWTSVALLCAVITESCNIETYGYISLFEVENIINEFEQNGVDIDDPANIIGHSVTVMWLDGRNQKRVFLDNEAPEMYGAISTGTIPLDREDLIYIRDSLLYMWTEPAFKGSGFEMSGVWTSKILIIFFSRTIISTEEEKTFTPIHINEPMFDEGIKIPRIPDVLDKEIDAQPTRLSVVFCL
jgi:hypothetical protein